jgi:preprotein translocase subunit YajC
LQKWAAAALSYFSSMRDLSVDSTTIFALQLVAQEKPAGEPRQSPIMEMLPLFVGIGLLFYFLMVRPAKKQEKEQAAMRDALKKNDEIVTMSGIIGTVVSVKKDKDEVTIESSNTRLRVLKSSIARVVTSSNTADKEEESDKKEDEKDDKEK